MATELILIDTNICLDAILTRMPFAEDALKIIELTESDAVKGKIAAHSLDTIFYILKREYNKKQIYALLKEFRNVFDIADVTQAVIDAAIALKWPDFEDAIQYQAAKAAGCNTIITRNKKDFKHSELSVFTAREYVENFSLN
ncbi:MAG: PIN domain-containing protein [Balneolaceae bacterium]